MIYDISMERRGLEIFKLVWKLDSWGWKGGVEVDEWCGVDGVLCCASTRVYITGKSRNGVRRLGKGRGEVGDE